MPPQTRIFISYRRTDAAPYAGRLYDALSREFGEEQIFMDIDSLTPGANFVDRIERAVGGVHVLLSVIGPGWLDARDESGGRRIDDPRDFVALEVGTALARDVLVIPVLVGGAKMPRTDQLPPALRSLTDRHALTLDDDYWRPGVERLVATIEAELGGQEERPEPQPDDTPVDPDERTDPLVPILALAGAAMLTVGLFVRWDSGHSFVDNDFGGYAPNGSYLTALAPSGLIALALVAAWLASRPAWRRAAAGILVGVGLAAVVKYLTVVWAALAADGVGGGARLGTVVALAGGVAVLAAGVRAIGALHAYTAPPPMLAAALGIAGAALAIAATFAPLNGGGPVLGRQVIAERSTREAFEPIAVGVACVILAVLLLAPRVRLLAGWALAAVSAVTALLWIRYVGVPLDQGDAVGGGVAWGGVLGLLGAIAAVAAGLAAVRAPRAEPRAVLAGP